MLEGLRVARVSRRPVADAEDRSHGRDAVLPDEQIATVLAREHEPIRVSEGGVAVEVIGDARQRVAAPILDLSGLARELHLMQEREVGRVVNDERGGEPRDSRAASFDVRACGHDAILAMDERAADGAELGSAWPRIQHVGGVEVLAVEAFEDGVVIELAKQDEVPVEGLGLDRPRAMADVIRGALDRNADTGVGRQGVRQLLRDSAVGRIVGDEDSGARGLARTDGRLAQDRQALDGRA